METNYLAGPEIDRRNADRVEFEALIAELGEVWRDADGEHVAGVTIQHEGGALPLYVSFGRYGQKAGTADFSLSFRHLAGLKGEHHYFRPWSVDKNTSERDRAKPNPRATVSLAKGAAKIKADLVRRLGDMFTTAEAHFKAQLAQESAEKTREAAFKAAMVAALGAQPGDSYDRPITDDKPVRIGAQWDGPERLRLSLTLDTGPRQTFTGGQWQDTAPRLTNDQAAAVVAAVLALAGGAA